MASSTHTTVEESPSFGHEAEARENSCDWRNSSNAGVNGEKPEELNKYLGVKLCRGTMIHNGLSIPIHIVGSYPDELPGPDSQFIPNGLYWPCLLHRVGILSDTSPCTTVIQGSLLAPEKNRMTDTERLQHLELCKGVVILDEVIPVALVILNPSEHPSEAPSGSPQGISWCHLDTCLILDQSGVGVDRTPCNTCCSTAMATCSTLTPYDKGEKDKPKSNIAHGEYGYDSDYEMIVWDSDAACGDGDRTPQSKSHIAITDSKKAEENSTKSDNRDNKLSEDTSSKLEMFVCDNVPVLCRGTILSKGLLIPISLVLLEPTLNSAVSEGPEGVFWTCFAINLHSGPQNRPGFRPCSNCILNEATSSPCRSCIRYGLSDSAKLSEQNNHSGQNCLVLSKGVLVIKKQSMPVAMVVADCLNRALPVQTYDNHPIEEGIYWQCTHEETQFGHASTPDTAPCGQCVSLAVDTSPWFHVADPPNAASGSKFGNS